MHTPSLSIIIPVYNGEKHLDRLFGTLDSQHIYNRSDDVRTEMLFVDDKRWMLLNMTVLWVYIISFRFISLKTALDLVDEYTRCGFLPMKGDFPLRVEETLPHTWLYKLVWRSLGYPALLRVLVRSVFTLKGTRQHLQGISMIITILSVNNGGV